MGDDNIVMADDCVDMGDDSIDMGNDSIDMGYIVALKQHRLASSMSKHAAMAPRNSSWGIGGKNVGADSTHLPWSSGAR
jgi:hypothetical protein